MDGNRFDEFTKRLATGTSRRRVLKGLMGGAVGGSLVALGFGGAPHRVFAADPNACAAPGASCATAGDCCQGDCKGGTCACSSDTSNPWAGCDCTAGDASSCGDGLVCCPTTNDPSGPGICAPTTTGCVPPPQCIESGDACAKNGDCCDGLVCCTASGDTGGPGTCTATAKCVHECSSGPGGTCESNADCCVGKCDLNAGICYCSDPARPDVGCPCQPGDSSACGGQPDLCCTNGTCASPSVGCQQPECKNAGDTCSADGDCCSGKCSDQGVCYCSDPARPLVGCACTTGTENPCGDSSLVCCANEGSAPGGPGTCTPSSVGCEQPQPLPPPPTQPAKAGTAAVSSLPATGSGAGGDGSGWIAPAAVIGAGAALVAAHKLRQPASQTEADTE